MASSKVAICNLALGHLGVDKPIQSLDTERSEESRACRTFYDQVRDECLRDWDWPFATKIAALALVSENPNSEWGFAYKYPSDCLKLRRILNGSSRITTPNMPEVPIKLTGSADGQLILTDQTLAFAEYTFRLDDPVRYPADFAMAMSFLLAAYIAPRVTGADPYKMRADALKLYDAKIDRASANSAQEEQVDSMPESSIILARG